MVLGFVVVVRWVWGFVGLLFLFLVSEYAEFQPLAKMTCAHRTHGVSTRAKKGQAVWKPPTQVLCVASLSSSPFGEEWTSAACDRLPSKLLSITGCTAESVTDSLELSGAFCDDFPWCLFKAAEECLYFALHEIGLHL